MTTRRVLPSAELWREGAIYYSDTVEALRSGMVLPDMTTLREQRRVAIFERHAGVGPTSHVLEIGCGGSAWLPYLAMRTGCTVAGIDVEPFAADLAKQNLAAAGVPAEIVCRDAFDGAANADLAGRFDVVFSAGVIEHFEDGADRLRVAASYLRPGGRMVTTVPNLQGINWALQLLGGVDRLRMHVLHDRDSLVSIHAGAGLRVLASGYAGFYDGWISAPGPSAGPLRRRLHRRACWLSSVGAAGLVRATGGRMTPELKWTSPHVFCVATRPA